MQFFSGDALSTLQNNIITLNQQGLVQVVNFDAVNSYIVDVRLINDNKIEVDTCQYWASAQYIRLTGAPVSSSPATLFPQTITIERFNANSWLITTVSPHTGQSFCQ